MVMSRKTRIILAIVGVGLAGFLIYKVFLEKESGFSDYPPRAPATAPGTTSSSANPGLSVRKETYSLDWGRGPVSAPRSIARNVNYEVVEVQKIPESLGDFAAYLISVNDRMVGRKTYAYFSRDESLDLKAGDILRDTDSLANLYEFYMSGDMPNVYWSIAKDLCGRREEVRKFLTGYFTPERVKMFSPVNFFAVLLQYEKSPARRAP